MVTNDQENKVSLKRIFGANVRHRRKWRRWTQEQLAQRALVSPRLITSIEHAKTNPSLDTVETIARAFKLDPTVLLDPSRDKTGKGG